MSQEELVLQNNVDDSMRLGSMEFKAMNNTIRRFIQKKFEFRYFRNMLKSQHINLNENVIIDAGCGSGYSSQLIYEKFAPARLIAFDYMPEQIKLAKARNEKKNLNINFFEGDIRKINEPSESIDGVFIFGVIHHIEDWQNALKEVCRVLKPNGALLIEEPHHRFEFDELEAEMEQVGFEILEKKKFLFGYFRSYLAMKL
jgi:ubiquinone/menaquinone biosynthesis C-methylase UbiE